METTTIRDLMARAVVGLLVALMAAAPLAGPMSAAATGRVFEEIVEEEVKYLHQSAAQLKRGRQKRRPLRNRAGIRALQRDNETGYESLVKPPCFWFCPPPLLRAPPVRV
jgi:hypothetical protein